MGGDSANVKPELNSVYVLKIECVSSAARRTRIRKTGLCAAEPAPEGGECSRSAFGSALADEVGEKSGGQTGQESALGDLGVLILAEPVQAHRFSVEAPDFRNTKTSVDLKFGC